MQRTFRYFLTVLITAGLLYSYNTSRWPDRSLTQIQFDKWLTETEQKLLDTEISNLAEITISHGKLGEAPDLSLNSSLSGDKIMRILNLAREANFFSLDETSEELYYLKVSGSENFTINFSAKDIEENPKAALMLKLFQVYAQSEIQIRLLAKTDKPSDEKS